MLYFSKLKIVIIYCIIIFLSLFAFANFIENKENFVLSKKVNLGLDLQGGSYLLLEVDSQPIIDRSLQEKLLQLRKYFIAVKDGFANLKNLERKPFRKKELKYLRKNNGRLWY